MKLLSEYNIKYIANCIKIIINGAWVGVIEFPEETMEKLKHYRRIGLISIYTSIFWQKEESTIFLYILILVD